MNTAFSYQRWLLAIATLSLVVATARAETLPPEAVCRLGKANDPSWVHGVEGTTFSPDRKLVATRSSDHIIRIYDVTSGQMLRALPELEEGRIKDLTFSHDSRHIVAATTAEKSTANAWAVATGKPIQGSGLPKTYAVRRTATLGVIAFATRLSIIYRSMADPTKTVDTKAMPNAGTQSEPATISPDGSGVLLRMFPSGGHRLLVISLDGNSPLPLDGFRRAVEQAEWSPNGRDIAATCRDDNRVYFRDAANPEYKINLAAHKADVQGIAFSPDGRHLVSADEAGSLRVWDTSRKQVLCEIKENPPRRLLSVEFSPDGRYLATGSSGGGRVRLPNAPAPAPTKPDNSAIVWNWKALLLANIEADESGSSWDLLASKNPKSAYSGIKSLVLDADNTTKLLSDKFGEKKQSLNREQIAKFIQQLNAPAFADRKAAHETLSLVRITAAEQLQAALESGSQPVETEVRLRKLLSTASETGEFNSDDTRRLLRAIYVLELIDSDDTHSLLESIAGSHPFDAIRNAAADSVKRMGPAKIQ